MSLYVALEIIVRWCFWLLVDIPLNGLADLFILVERYIVNLVNLQQSSSRTRRSGRSVNRTRKSYIQDLQDLLQERKRQFLVAQARRAGKGPEEAERIGRLASSTSLLGSVSSFTSITDFVNGGRTSGSSTSGSGSNNNNNTSNSWWRNSWFSGGDRSLKRKVTISQLLKGLETPIATPEEARLYLSPVDWKEETSSSNNLKEDEDPHFRINDDEEEEEDDDDDDGGGGGGGGGKKRHHLRYYLENQISPSVVFGLWERRLGPRPELFLSDALDASTSRKRKTLVLDLDETLLHATTVSTRDYDYMMEVLVGKIACLYYVRKRPFVDYFLDTVRQWYDLVVYTASVPEYADPVLDWLDDGRNLFSRRLFRQDCIPMEFELGEGDSNESVIPIAASSSSAVSSVVQQRTGTRSSPRRKAVSASTSAGTNSRRVLTYVKDLTLIDQDLCNICLIDNSLVSFELQPGTSYDY